MSEHCCLRTIGCGFESRCSHLNFRYHFCFEQIVLDIQATIKCRLTLKRVRDIITYSQGLDLSSTAFILLVIFQSKMSKWGSNSWNERFWRMTIIFLYDFVSYSDLFYRERWVFVSCLADITYLVIKAKFIINSYT